MADDRHYVHGDFYRIDDRTGFKVRNKRTRKEWTNLIVDQDRWEYRQPQDFVKGVIDDQTVPDPRPRQTDVFLGFLSTVLTANAGPGSVVLHAASCTRFLNNDVVEIMLNNDTFYRTTVASVISGIIFQIPSPGLPSAAASGNIINNLTAVAPANIGL